MAQKHQVPYENRAKKVVMNMKKKYQTADIEIIEIEKGDVMTGSPDNDLDPDMT